MAIASDETRFIPSRVLESRVSELLSASCTLSATSPTIVEFYRDFRSKQEAVLAPAARDFLAGRGAGIESITMSLCDYLPITEELQDWPAFARSVGSVPIDSFLYVLFNCDIPQAEIARLLGEPRTAPAWLPRLSYYSLMDESAIVRIFSEPESFRSGLLEYVGANDTAVFQESLEEGAQWVEARCGAIRERLKTADPLVVAREVTKKDHLVDAEPRSACTFIPARFIGRKNIVSLWTTKLFVYFSVYPTAQEPKAASKVLASRLKVLGDATRLDILLYLRQGPSYCKELSRWLNLSPATVSRQLDQLKAIGLVTEDPPGPTNVKIVRLAPGAFDGLYSELESFLASRSGE